MTAAAGGGEARGEKKKIDGDPLNQVNEHKSQERERESVEKKGFTHLSTHATSLTWSRATSDISDDSSR